MAHTITTVPAQRSSVVARYAWLWDAGSLVAGSLAVMAFAPLNWRLLAIVSLAFLYLAVSRDSVRRACWRGWLYGLGFFGVGVSWIQISIHQFGLPVLAFSVSATALFVAFVALFPAAFAAFARRYAVQLDGLRKTVVLAALWTLMEWIRSWIFTGFPWLTLGYTQTAATLSGYAPLGGVFLVSFFLAFSAAALAVSITGRPRLSVVVLVVVVWGLGGGLRSINWTRTQGEPIEVVLVQGNVAQSMKWLASERDASIRTYLRLTEPFWGRSQLIIWPETAVPALYDQASDLFEQLQAAAKHHGTELLTGVPYRDLNSGRFYNSAVSIGQTVNFYHKRHLVPFGEYMPLKALLGPVLTFLDIPMSDFSSGPDQQPDLAVANHTVGVSICYEDVFGEEVIQSLPGADFLVNISNDAWFGDSLAPHQHLQMAQMRAIEAGRYMLRSTNTGVTAVVDSQGQILAKAPQFEATTLNTKVQAMVGMTPYARTGNAPIVVLLATIFALNWRRGVLLMRDGNGPA